MIVKEKNEVKQRTIKNHVICIAILHTTTNCFRMTFFFRHCVKFPFKNITFVHNMRITLRTTVYPPLSDLCHEADIDVINRFAQAQRPPGGIAEEDTDKISRKWWDSGGR